MIDLDRLILNVLCLVNHEGSFMSRQNKIHCYHKYTSDFDTCMSLFMIGEDWEKWGSAPQPRQGACATPWTPGTFSLKLMIPSR